MKNFILTAAALAFAGITMTEAKTISNNNFSLQDTVKKDTVTTPADTTKKEAGFAYANEQEPTTSNAEATQEQAPAADNQDRKEVKLDELPDAVKQTLTADIFKEWIPQTAYVVNANGSEHYLIEVKKGEELRSIKIGTDGKVVN
ncbi:hypothetical protein [Pseudopedobacter beijingensis]|uniref:PepSY domain-containing protein n=1 Tax=Pseudopedobacter beijingensis TaxID=1207056 RepID=A0ABW4IAR5_9SPHI